MIARTLVALERFLLPNACIVCAGAVPPDQPDGLICAVCRTRPRAVVGGCPRCHQPLPPVGPCRFCASWLPAMRWVHSAFWLGPETRAIVHHLKYENCPGLASLIGQLMTPRMPQPPEGWLIPVPTGPRRLRERGYNQTEEIARDLGRRWHRPVASQALARVRDARSQTALTPDARLANVAGAFVAKGAPAQATDAARGATGTAILVDDVLTTGATLLAAAEALASAGWASVGAITFARAMPYQTRLITGSP